jgi:lysozyme
MFLNLQTFGIDISHHDDPIDWDSLVSEIDPKFVFARAYHIGDTPDPPSTYPDPSFPEYWQKLGDKHLPRGAYLFCNPHADADDSIKRFFDVYQPKKGDLLPVLDIEDNYDSDSHVPLDKRLTQIARMVKLISDKIGGQKPIIYTKKRGNQ